MLSSRNLFLENPDWCVKIDAGVLVPHLIKSQDNDKNRVSGMAGDLEKAY